MTGQMPKKSAKISAKAGARVRPRKKHPKRNSKTWMACGFDLSMASLAGAAFAYDGTLKNYTGPFFTMKSWPVNTHYFDKLHDCVNSDDLVHELQIQMKLVAELDEVYIAIEEPFPTGMVKRLESNAIKQQAEISGAFIAGLLKHGFKNVYQIPWYQWAQIVAADLSEWTGEDITIHHSKWNYKINPFELAPHGKGSGKWRSKEWAQHLGEQRGYYIPDWTDLIHREKTGKIPRPEGSKARAVQPDDRYDALPIAEWMRQEFLRSV